MTEEEIRTEITKFATHAFMVREAIKSGSRADPDHVDEVFKTGIRLVSRFLSDISRLADAADRLTKR